MHIWILKYGKSGFSTHFVDEAKNLATTIEQLKFSDISRNQLGNFHFISITTQFEKSQKKYIEYTDNIVKGYSGLLLDKTAIDLDLRKIENIEINHLEQYSGQFSIFNLNIDSFECVVDNFGFHKVFYFKRGNDIFVSNSMELLKKTGLLQPNREQILLDLMTSKFGVFPGYNTLFEDVYTLPEYGKLTIKNGDLIIDAYKTIEELLSPTSNFENQLELLIQEFKTNAAYLRKYHHAVVPLSGGFDGRLILSFFYNTNGLPLETLTYNRAGYLDFLIAKILSRKFKVPHKKIVIPTKLDNFNIAISEFQNSNNDPFYFVFKNAVKDFYNAANCFKVSLGGNGADTDWEFGEKQLKSVDKSNFRSFIKSYSALITKHPLIRDKFSEEMAVKVEKYFLTKYASFENKPNFMQLLASAFFHLERFRSRQGYVYSQEANKMHDVFAPFASENFNKLVFLSNKNQLQRTLKEGINYRIYHAMTNGAVPWAPVLTAKNEFGNNPFQKFANAIFPYLPKIEWKLRNGDINTRLRKGFDGQSDQLSRKYIHEFRDEKLYDFLDENMIKEDLKNNIYKGKYNNIATILKFIENNTK